MHSLCVKYVPKTTPTDLHHITPNKTKQYILKLTLFCFATLKNFTFLSICVASVSR